MKTYSQKQSEVERSWHLVDAQGEVLGRLATKLAGLLIGKHKPTISHHIDGGDYVVVLNAKGIVFTGRKPKQKMYYRHSGYMGNLKAASLTEMMEKDARRVIRLAVSGMLPKNKLRQLRLKRLKVFVDEKHPFQDKFTNKTSKKSVKAKGKNE